jgi:biopolymer transport protein ExbD
MGMNVKSDLDEDEGSVMSEINVTPLVDVMLVLLIIFIVTAPLALSVVPVKLPKAGLDEMGKPVDPLVLSLDLAGNYYFEENHRTATFTEAELPARLADAFTRYKQFAGKDRFPVVYLRADNEAEYGKVYNIIKKLTEAGFYRVSLMSEAPQ